MKINKKIVYWGAGRYGKWCLEYHSEIVPCFFIDTNGSRKEMDGIEIKKPEDIDNWSEYFVIITIKSQTAKNTIESYLNQQGLIENVDYCSYNTFFGVDELSVDQCCEEASIIRLQDESPIILLIISVYDIRNISAFRNFIKKYVFAREKENKKVVILTELRVLTRKEIQAFVNGIILPKPSFSDMEDTCISEQSIRLLNELESRKKAGSYSHSLDVGILYFYEKLFRKLCPTKVIVWGGWQTESYIITELAKEKKIVYGFMEHGWLPGTYQVDSKGIMGQGKYTGISLKQYSYDIDKIQKIKQYIRDTKLDTRVFLESERDKDILASIRPERKTIFLVGMDDSGMQMDNHSEYWKKKISSVVESSEDALQMLIPICKKKKWNLIYKPHPGNAISKWVEDCEDITLVTSTSVDKLIQMADVVVSVASAVDFKTLLNEKPLVQLGLNGLIGKACSYVIDKRQDLEPMLENALINQMTDVQKQNYDLFIATLLNDCLWDDLTDREVQYGLSLERDFLDE